MGAAMPLDDRVAGPAVALIDTDASRVGRATADAEAGVIGGPQ